MRGLRRAAVLLAPALARASHPLPSPDDEISSAYIKLGPLGSKSADQHDLTFRLDINESRDACGYANVTINGDTLPEGGCGTLVLDGGVAVVASWNFTCVSWDGRPQEQLMNFDVEFADGRFVDNLGFTVRFQQVRPVWISEIEGPASITRVHKAKQHALTPSTTPAAGAEEGGADDAEEDPEAELEREMAELDYLHFQMIELGSLIRAKEARLRDKFDPVHPEHRGPPPTDLGACGSLKCVFASFYHKVADAAAAIYGDVGPFGRFFEGDRPRGPHGVGRGGREGRPRFPPFLPPYHGKGNHSWPPHHRLPHHGNHSHHGNHTWPRPPPWWRKPHLPPVHPPPFCKCPPAHPPPHPRPPGHGRPHPMEPPHHSPTPPPLDHTPPSHDDLSSHHRPPLDGPPHERPDHQPQNLLHEESPPDASLAHGKDGHEAPSPFPDWPHYRHGPPDPPSPLFPPSPPPASSLPPSAGPERDDPPYPPPPSPPPPPVSPLGHPHGPHGPSAPPPLIGVHMTPSAKIAISAGLLLTFVAMVLRRCLTKHRGGKSGSHHRQRHRDGPKSSCRAFADRLFHGRFHNHAYHRPSYSYDYEKGGLMDDAEKPDRNIPKRDEDPFRDEGLPSYELVCSSDAAAAVVADGPGYVPGRDGAAPAMSRAARGADNVLGNGKR